MPIMFRFALLVPLVACAATLDDPSLDGSMPVVSNHGGDDIIIVDGENTPFVCLIWDDQQLLADWAEENLHDGSCAVIICPPLLPDWPDGFGVHMCNTPDDDGPGPIIDGVEVWYEDLFITK